MTAVETYDVGVPGTGAAGTAGRDAAVRAGARALVPLP